MSLFQSWAESSLNQSTQLCWEAMTNMKHVYRGVCERTQEPFGINPLNNFCPACKPWYVAVGSTNKLRLPESLSEVIVGTILLFFLATWNNL